MLIRIALVVMQLHLLVAVFFAEAATTPSCISDPYLYKPFIASSLRTRGHHRLAAIEHLLNGEQAGISCRQPLQQRFAERLGIA